MSRFEIAVQDVAGVSGAPSAGADRIELCGALAVGGVTPSVGFIEAAVAGALPVHVLIRPRPGGFGYDAEEVAVALADVRGALRSGAAGVVVGGLREGVVDDAFVAAVVEAASGAEVTFHRAFDGVPDRRRALDALIRRGVTRVLTSGGADRAVDALGEIRSLVDHAAGAVQIMAGGGIDAGNVREVLATGVDAVHASASRDVPEELAVRLGSASPAGSVARGTLDVEAARRIAELVHAETAG